ncbi:hypothetical protein [Myceligenerans pegani]|uniref:Uncharacterized protein n=1 Tax=Myceligenerans pegani TaxID=2776917 RepID=A0ABR9MXM9_9MICO|nr:hypothetical protein [Myceligenerans sp. TRM 65318]MBE1875603.1 hypothetical protein [Myceligenerans sp. TRM 65318]MBE3017874.1 hypothetical protein [Myceligenerans sp. TRM 65318]
MDATDGTHREARPGAPALGPATGIDASFGSRAKAGRTANGPAGPAVTAERATAGPGPNAVVALVMIGIAGAAAVAYLVRRLTRRATRAVEPVLREEPVPTPETSPRPRHGAPKFVVDDSGEFPSLR